jgi:T5SS/PEP-CTERM-associated repeat protein/autotransporter-associated beta strand protein
VSADDGGNGTVTVDGPRSALNVANAAFTRVTIGQGGTATLKVTNGGTMFSRHQFRTAQNLDSTALVEVDGADSKVSADSCHLSGAGVTTVQISNAGLLRCQSTAGLSNGSVTLSGAASKWTVGTELYVGSDNGREYAVVNIGDGSAVEVGSRLRLGFSTDGQYRGPSTINIDGTTTPGALTAPAVQFGPGKGGIINVNHTDTSGNYVLASSVTGPGTVNITQPGTTVFTGSNAYSGLTNVKAGVLRAGAPGGLSPQSDFVVASDSTVDTGSGDATILSLSNAGKVTMTAGGTTSTLTVTGNYASDNGTIEMNTVLGDSGSATEKLVIHGDSSGDTVLNITNVGGTGAPTTGLGIMVVQVNGASNGTFRLPAPGYLQVGSFRYDLVKTGNHWYLVNESRAESAPVVGVVCTPAELSDAAGQVATCKVSLNAALTSDLSVNLALPAASARYTTTCSSPIVVPANATEASCTITSVPNNTANDGDVTATLAIAPPTVADAYTVNGPAAQVLIKDKDKTGGDNGGGDNGGGDNGGGNGGGDNGGGNGGGDNGGGTAVPHKVPTMGAVGLMAMASVLGLLGVRRTRSSGTPQSGTRRAPGTSA